MFSNDEMLVTLKRQYEIAKMTYFTYLNKKAKDFWVNISKQIIQKIEYHNNKTIVNCIQLKNFKNNMYKNNTCKFTDYINKLNKIFKIKEEIIKNIKRKKINNFKSKYNEERKRDTIKINNTKHIYHSSSKHSHTNCELKQPPITDISKNDKIKRIKKIVEQQSADKKDKKKYITSFTINFKMYLIWEYNLDKEYPDYYINRNTINKNNNLYNKIKNNKVTVNTDDLKKEFNDKLEHKGGNVYYFITNLLNLQK